MAFEDGSIPHDGLMPDENIVVPDENIDVPDGLSESEASDVNNLYHMESDEDDPELVGVKAKGKATAADKGMGITTEEDLTGYNTNYGNSSDYHSPSDEDDEQENDKVFIIKRPMFPTYIPNSDPFKFEPKLGMKFANPKELKFVLICYAVANGKNISFPRSAHYKLKV
ncbi:hypothetical protein FRX31_031774 [Thalictrum thalictroides]|uniref:Uncharacterized protein n=1 Tax=Thalictrum thalictroides TaxID=46969 RepID=A0A7J6V1F2_THATH|nr:hypothetical protein FRX31_031774 [Thalictrum thalictroides]